MKSLFAAALLTLGLAGAGMANPVHGTWASPKGESGASFQVTIKDCGNSVCGNITKLAGGADPAIKGRQMVWDMKSKGGGTYKGRIWAPDTDKTYSGKMELNGNTLKMSGCILGICRGEDFKRVK